MAISADPARQFAEVAATFAATVESVNDWEAQTPVPEWRAKDVVFHLTDWVPGLLNSASAADLPMREPDATPDEAWASLQGAIQRVLDDDELSSSQFSHPKAGDMTVAQAFERFVTADLFMHTWDLAQSNGIEVSLDEDYAGNILGGMRSMEDMIRGSGQYGDTAIEPPAGADNVTALMCFIGRAPDWRAKA